MGQILRNGCGVRAALVAAAGLAIAMHAGASPLFTTIALSNTDGALGPGMGSGTAFTSATGAALNGAVLNNLGRAMFIGATGAAGGPPFPATQNVGIFEWTGLGNISRALSGSAASDGTAYTTNLLFPNIKGSNNYAFRETTSAAHAGWGSNAELAARIGSTMPGTGGATLNAVSTSPQIMLTDSGMIGFRGNLNAGTGSPVVTTAANVNNQGGLWSGPSGGLVLRARNNDATPIANVNLGVIDSGVGSAVMNNSGQFVFTTGLQSTVAGTVVSGAAGNDLAIATTLGGSLSIVARKGDAAAGSTVANEQYRTFTNPGVNHAGHISFVSSMRVGSTTTDTAIFRNTGSGVQMAVRGTTAAVQNPQALMPSSTGFSNAYWGNFFSDVIMNGSGAMAFKGTGIVAGAGATGTNGQPLTTSNSGGIFTCTSSGAIRTIMQTGTSAVGAPGALYSSFQSGFAFNNAGQVAWVSSLVDDPNIPTTDVWTDLGGAPPGEFGNNLALYATDANGVVCLVFRKNDLFEVAPGDVRRIRAFAVGAAGGAEDGRSEWFNDYGHMVVTLTFADFSSAVVHVQVPAPASAAILALGGFAMTRRRRS